MQILTIVLWLFFTAIIFIFPILIDFELEFIKENKILYYNLKVFKVISIIKGYVVVIKGDIVLIKNNKIIFLKPLKFDGFKEQIKPLFDLHIVKYNLLVKIGQSNLDNIGLPSIVFGNSCYNLFINFIRKSKPYLKSYANLYITENNCIDIFLNIQVLLNLVVIIINLIKYVTEKLINVFK